jgi:transposase
VPEVGFNAAVLHRELQALGFIAGIVQVKRRLRPYREQRKWSELATVRFETGPDEQAQVDYGQLWVWIGVQLQKVHLFVFTLGYSRRLYAHPYRHERLSSLLDGQERAFRWFGGVTLSCLYDNPRTLVLGRRENKVLWRPQFEDFARYYGFTLRACQPYRARTKGKVENGVKYVKRNPLDGRRFRSREELNDWLERWSLEVADQRIHGTTHERPAERFAQEQLTPLGTVSVQESTEHYEILHRARLIARHPKAACYSVVMEPTHYAGLLRAGGRPSPGSPPLRSLLRRFRRGNGARSRPLRGVYNSCDSLCEEGIFRTLHHGSG